MTHRFISLTTSILNFSEYISENCLRVNAQPWSPEPKPTDPLEGSANLTHRSSVIVIGGNDNVYVLDDALEGLVQLLGI